VEEERRLLTEQCDKNGGGDGVGGLTGGEVTAFLLRECTRLSLGPAKGVVAELRSLLRFLYVVCADIRCSSSTRLQSSPAAIR